MGSSNNIKQSIIKTVLYADIFDYPLNSKQIWKYLIAEKRVNKKEFDEILKNISSPVFSFSDMYFLKGKKKLVNLKIKRRMESGKKLSVAYKIIYILSFIPCVLMIGISGGLSMENSDRKDDIDIFVVTKKNRVWLTRILFIIILKIIKKHRGRKDQAVGNKICLNMLVDEDNLSFAKNKNIYIAHEISQLIPVFDRNNTYAKFLDENTWVKKFLPNALPELNYKKIKFKKNNEFLKSFFDYLEIIVKKIQLWYINKHITIEKIDNGLLSFHPFNYSEYIIDSYENKIKKYE